MNFYKLLYTENRHLWKLKIILFLVVVFLLVSLISVSSVAGSIGNGFDMLSGNKTIYISQMDRADMAEYASDTRSLGGMKINEGLGCCLQSGSNFVPEWVPFYRIIRADDSTVAVSRQELLQMLSEEAPELSSSSIFSEDGFTLQSTDFPNFNVTFSYASGKFMVANREYYSAICSELCADTERGKAYVFLSDTVTSMLGVECGDTVQILREEKVFDVMVGGVYPLDYINPPYIIDGHGIPESFFPASCSNVWIECQTKKEYYQTSAFFEGRNIKYDPDEGFLQLEFASSALTFGLWMMAFGILILQLGMIRWIAAFLLDIRRDNILRWKLLGATDWQVARLYSFLFIPGLGGSVLLGLALAGGTIYGLQEKFEALFQVQLNVNIVYWIAILVFFCYCFSLLFSLKRLLGKKKQYMAYELLRTN